MADLTSGQLAEIDRLIEEIKTSDLSPKYILDVLCGLKAGRALAEMPGDEVHVFYSARSSENH
jgi:hypothetical protein